MNPLQEENVETNCGGDVGPGREVRMQEEATMTVRSLTR